MKKKIKIIIEIEGIIVKNEAIKKRIIKELKEEIRRKTKETIRNIENKKNLLSF